mmetsp:Transcript_53926/g.89297  ORF Transcript_53926/g.89297 Transcript_53926/m.89297 type:complete len:150 (+) Transcript_53926:690-1139(+)
MLVIQKDDGPRHCVIGAHARLYLLPGHRDDGQVQLLCREVRLITYSWSGNFFQTAANWKMPVQELPDALEGDVTGTLRIDVTLAYAACARMRGAGCRLVHGRSLESGRRAVQRPAAKIFSALCLENLKWRTPGTPGELPGEGRLSRGRA